MPDTPRFLPHTTVATVIERSGQFLLVEEVSQGIAVLNQPAGHLEQHESLIDAAARETLEETAGTATLRRIWASPLSLPKMASVIYDTVSWRQHWNLTTP